MSEIRSRLAIAASLLWLLLASFLILGTHADVVAQLGAEEVGMWVPTAPAADMLLTPEALGQC